MEIEIILCEHCKDWGRTIDPTTLKYPVCLIPCRICGRETWPNLGVNLPAGCAVSLCTVSCINIARVTKGIGSLDESDGLIYAEMNPGKDGWIRINERMDRVQADCKRKARRTAITKLTSWLEKR